MRQRDQRPGNNPLNDAEEDQHRQAVGDAAGPEAMAKAVVDHRNSFTSPTRLASHPVIGMEMALATPNEVMTGSPAQR